jgi:hypothetical protein
MRGLRLLPILALAAMLLAQRVDFAQDLNLPVEQHPWARFPVGSWKSVRVVSETLDENGTVAGVIRTETRTTLLSVDREGYSLRIESTVEVAGKRFASQPQIVKHGYYGETVGQPVTVKKLGEAEVTIDGRTVSSELRQARYDADGEKRVSMIYYSSRISPYQLRRETTTEGLPEDQGSKTTVETVALNMPEKVLGEIRTGAVVKTTRKSPQGTKVTLEVQCDHVPGGVVSHSASETDASGRTIRRSTLELIDYAIGGHPVDADPVTKRRHRPFQRRMN